MDSRREFDATWLGKARTNTGTYDLTRLPGDLVVQIEPDSEEAMTLRPLLRAAGALSGDVARLMEGEPVRLDALLGVELVAHHLRSEARLVEWLAGVEEPAESTAEAAPAETTGEAMLRAAGWTGPIIRPDGRRVPVAEASGSGAVRGEGEHAGEDDTGDDDGFADPGDELPWPEEWDAEPAREARAFTTFFGTVEGPFAEYDEQERPLMEVYTATQKRSSVDGKRRMVADVLVDLHPADIGRSALMHMLEPGRYVLILRKANGRLRTMPFAFGGRGGRPPAAGEQKPRRRSVSAAALRMARESDQVEIARLTKAIERSEARNDKLVEQLDALREKRHEERMAYIAKMSEGVTQEDLVDAVVDALEERAEDEPQSMMGEAKDLFLALQGGGGGGGLFGGAR